MEYTAQGIADVFKGIGNAAKDIGASAQGVLKVYSDVKQQGQDYQLTKAAINANASIAQSQAAYGIAAQNAMATGNFNISDFLQGKAMGWLPNWLMLVAAGALVYVLVKK